MQVLSCKYTNTENISTVVPIACLHTPPSLFWNDIQHDMLNQRKTYWLKSLHSSRRGTESEVDDICSYIWALQQVAQDPETGHNLTSSGLQQCTHHHLILVYSVSSCQSKISQILPGYGGFAFLRHICSHGHHLVIRETVDTHWLAW